MMLFAVHLSDGVVQPAWWIGGWVMSGLILGWASRGLKDEEISLIGALTGSIFVASQLHLPLGGVSVHLLLNGLAGMILPRRAPIAISIGLLMQALLFGHGGLTTLGLNAVVYSLPAIGAGLAGRWLVKRDFIQSNVIQLLGLLIATETLTICLIEVSQITIESYRAGLFQMVNQLRDLWLLEWWAWVILGSVALVTSILHRYWRPTVYFSLGMFIGGGTAFVTVMFSTTVLALGGINEVKALVGVVLVTHLPVIFLESIIVGFAFAYLKQVKPEWLNEPKA